MVSVILQFTGSDITLIRLSLIQVLSCNCKKEKVIFSEPIKRFFDLVKEARKGLSWKMMTIELRSKGTVEIYQACKGGKRVPGRGNSICKVHRLS